LSRITLATLTFLTFWLTGCSPDLAPVYTPIPLPLWTATPTPFQPFDPASPSPTLTQPPAVTATPLPVTETSTATLPVYLVFPLGVPLGSNPLTGLLPQEPACLERRPVAVKIANYPRDVRPQYGLTQADHIFEYYIEDGLTRFIAIFYGKDASRAGPIRSARYFDEHIVRMYQASFVFAGADARVEKYLLESDLLPILIVQRDDNCPPLCIDKRIKGYSNLFVDTSGVGEYLAYRGADNSRPALESGYYANYAPLAGPVAGRVFFRYSAFDYNYWEYDPTRQQYVRYQETSDVLNNKPPAYELLTDALTSQPVVADNLFVLYVTHNFRTEGEAADQVFHIDLINSGDAFVFRDGRGYSVKWNRLDTNQPLVITDASGAPFPLKMGVMFFQVIGVSSTYNVEGGDWFFEFHVP